MRSAFRRGEGLRHAICSERLLETYYGMKLRRMGWVKKSFKFTSLNQAAEHPSQTVLNEQCDLPSRGEFNLSVLISHRMSLQLNMEQLKLICPFLRKQIRSRRLLRSNQSFPSMRSVFRRREGNKGWVTPQKIQQPPERQPGSHSHLLIHWLRQSNSCQSRYFRGCIQ